MELTLIWDLSNCFDFSIVGTLSGLVITFRPIVLKNVRAFLELYEHLKLLQAIDSLLEIVDYYTR